MSSDSLSDSMRILCVTPWFPASPGDQSGNFIFDSVNALMALGHDVKVLVVKPWHPWFARWLHPDWGRPRLQCDTHKKSFGLEEISYLSVPRNYLRAISNWTFSQNVVPGLKRVSKSFRPEIILAHTELPGMAAVEVGRENAIPVVVVLHGINPHPRLNTGTQLRIVGETLDKADRVILVGEPLVKHFSPIVGRTDHFRIVHNGFRKPSVEDCREISSWGSPLKFISVSNLHEGKGIDLTLQALASLYKKNLRDWNYTIVGDGRERASLEEIAKKLGIERQVKFVGTVSHDEVFGFMAKANVFVLPSYREAFGVAYLEAMGCGLLTIAVQGQGPGAFINHHETGLLTPPRDVVALADTLEEVITKPTDMQAIAAKGREFVQQEFTWQCHAEKLVGVLQELVVN